MLRAAILSLGIEPHPRIGFAAFVEMAGTTSWDNHDGADYVLE